jgi:hypothetical protein
VRLECVDTLRHLKIMNNFRMNFGMCGYTQTFNDNEQF